MKVNEVKQARVLITLDDGIEREVKLTLNAMAELEEKYGSVNAAFEALKKGSIKAVRFMLWAGFIHDEEHPITEQQVGNLITVQSMERIMGALKNVIATDMPEGDGDTVAPIQDPNE